MPNNIDVTSPGDSAALANSLGGFLYMNPDSPYRNDMYDAFRHAYGSAKFSEAFGDTISKFFMDYHEKDSPLIEANMDKWNNNVGREEFHLWVTAKTAGQTTDSLEKWIYNRVNERKTINNPFDPNETRQWSESSVSNNQSSFNQVLDFENIAYQLHSDILHPVKN